MVDPYTYGDSAGEQHQMSQYNQSNAQYPSIPSGPTHVGDDLAMGLGAGAGAAAGGAAAAGAPRRGPSSASTLTSAGFAGRGAGQYAQGYDEYGTPMGMPLPGSSSQGAEAAGAARTPSTAASRKMREAQQERMRNTEGGAQAPAGNINGLASPTETTTDSDVVVHSDGGRVELPPT